MATTPTADYTIAELRQQAGLTQVELAIQAQCSTASVALLEAGYQPKRSEVLKRIRAVLERAD